MPEGAKERGVGLSGSLPNVAAVEKIIFEKLNARRVTALAPSPAEVRWRRVRFGTICPRSSFRDFPLWAIEHARCRIFE